MEIYLFRHGIAEDGGPGKADASRQLTAEGRQKTAAVVKLARRAGVAPSLIVSSPYARAVQTAEIAAAELGIEREQPRLDSLTPDGTPEEAWNELREYRGEPGILVTGHEPLLSQMVGYLLGAPALRVEMKKAAMVRIDVEAVRAHPRGVLRWMITPGLT